MAPVARASRPVLALGCLVVSLACLVSASARAAPDAGGLDAGARDGGQDAASPAAEVEPDPDADSLREKAARIRALGARTLELQVEPRTLFEQALDDERAIRIEIERLRAVLAGAHTADAGVVLEASIAAGDAAPDAVTHELAPLDTRGRRLLVARLELDAARHDWLSRPQGVRRADLDAHAERQRQAKLAGTSGRDADLRAEAAAKEREEAREEARRARSEAEKVVAEERVRLLGIKEEQARFESGLAKLQEQVEQRGEVVLTWRRRVGELLEKPAAGGDAADRMYDELRRTLRDARSDLEDVLAAIAGHTSRVPDAGVDSLDTGGVAVDRRDVDTLREAVNTRAQELRRREADERWSRAQSLLDQVESLNRSRLALYPRVSAAKRQELTGFSATGFEQAAGEGRQLSAVTRYHLFASLRWARKLVDPDRDRTRDLFAGLTLLKVLLLAGALWWWRRRWPDLHAAVRAQVEERRTAIGSSRAQLSLERALDLAGRVHTPVLWLLGLGLALWITGPTVSDQYAIRLLWIVLLWTLGGNIAVHAIDVGFSSGSERTRPTDALRLRSFRLIGRVIVAVGLFLALTTEIVGRGTIYDWVLSTCWFAVLPVGLVIVRWWKPTVFSRAEGLKKRGPLLEWVLSRRGGWASFPAAALGGASLIALGVWRRVRAYVSTFDATRRVLAYLFRREVTKTARERERHEVSPLDEETLRKLDPKSSSGLLPSVGGEIGRVVQCLQQPGGGVFAVVGERGGGKSSLLQRILDHARNSVHVVCPPSGYEAFRDALATALGLPPGASDDEIVSAVRARSEDSAIVVDATQRLVRPAIGGLAAFDRVVDLARRASSRVTWVFSVDEAIWPFVERARGTRPLFDDVIGIRPWPEPAIAQLLRTRSEAADLTPIFDELLAEHEEDDEELRAERLQNVETNYYRLLWDYAEGNPAVALHFWSESLGVDAEGLVRVQLFSTPDPADLHRLPDAAVFVLRAVLQLDLATAEAVREVTMLPAREVDDALRYAEFRGYLEREDGHYRLRLHWFRAIKRFLQRRHLVSDLR